MIPDEILQVYLCNDDPVHFIRTFIKVYSPTKGIIPFEMHAEHECVINSIHTHQFNLVHKPRQVGMTTTMAAYILWYSIFHRNKLSLVVGTTAEHSKQIFGTIREMYELLPDYFKTAKWRASNAEFSSGSRILFSGPSPCAVRGLTVSLLYLDEFGFVKQHLQEDFWSSIAPTLTLCDTCVMASSPPPRPVSGVNIFGELLEASFDKNETSTFNTISFRRPLAMMPQDSYSYFESPIIDSSKTKLVTQWLEQTIQS